MGALTSFVACALAASCKVKGFSNCQLGKVGVSLIYVAGSSLRNELVKGVAVVGDVSLDLQQTWPVVDFCACMCKTSSL